MCAYVLLLLQFYVQFYLTLAFDTSQPNRAVIKPEFTILHPMCEWIFFFFLNLFSLLFSAHSWPAAFLSFLSVIWSGFSVVVWAEIGQVDGSMRGCRWGSALEVCLWYLGMK